VTYPFKIRPIRGMINVERSSLDCYPQVSTGARIHKGDPLLIRRSVKSSWPGLASASFPADPLLTEVRAGVDQDFRHDLHRGALSPPANTAPLQMPATSASRSAGRRPFPSVARRRSSAMAASYASPSGLPACQWNRFPDSVDRDRGLSSAHGARSVQARSTVQDPEYARTDGHCFWRIIMATHC
jgi:hypothetical protein